MFPGNLNFRSKLLSPDLLVVSLSRRVRNLVSTLQLQRALRVVGPGLVALSCAGVAHAQVTMDFSGAQTLMGSFKTFAIYAGAVICFGGLIFAGIRMLSGRFSDVIPGLFGALFGAGVLGCLFRGRGHVLSRSQYQRSWGKQSCSGQLSVS